MAATLVTPPYSGCRVNPSPQKRGPVNYHAGRWSHYPSRRGELRGRLERLPERQERLLLRRPKKPMTGDYRGLFWRRTTLAAVFTTMLLQDQGTARLDSAKTNRRKRTDGLLFRTRAPSIEGIRRKESGCRAGPRPAGTTWCRRGEQLATARYYRSG